MANCVAGRKGLPVHPDMVAQRRPQPREGVEQWGNRSLEHQNAIRVCIFTKYARVVPPQEFEASSAIFWTGLLLTSEPSALTTEMVCSLTLRRVCASFGEAGSH